MNTLVFSGAADTLVAEWFFKHIKKLPCKINNFICRMFTWWMIKSILCRYPPQCRKCYCSYITNMYVNDYSNHCTITLYTFVRKFGLFITNNYLLSVSDLPFYLKIYFLTSVPDSSYMFTQVTVLSYMLCVL